ncbi:BRO-N domain-containing protein [Streptomyces antibioticus]|uniref:Bro-N domain-containing protein n=1 Tax=Streptomyces antibioticus TaxID=1890 RepID=A0AAE6Y9N2_STRAT|nr:Bro-N domain-containing protein [Streptomyces antibioticus]OOQ50211.1 DNA-binding protein [Streptomyces antibioticus]QIT45628.1 Bro-N domain-containing protein [Streptomyces antibioticus]
MYEQNNIPSDESTGRRQDAIDINDFVFAATGARVRRLTMPDGEHWFPAMDVAKHLGYANTRDAVQSAVSQQHTTAFGDIARSVGLSDARRNTAGHGFRTTMKLVNLRGLIELVNGCTKPEAQPFRSWVSEVIATVQRDGSYALEPAAVQPAPSGGTAYVMPDQVAEAIVRLEERNVRADEMILAFQKEQTDLLRQMTDALKDIAGALRNPDARGQEATPAELLATWRSKNLIVTDDIHAVAAVLAPALLRGEAHYRIEEIATRTGLPHERVHDCLRMLLKRGCMRQTGCASDGAPVYVLP